MSTWVFRKKGDTNVWKEIILFIIFFMEATHSSLMRDFRILLLSVLLEPPKEMGLTRGSPEVFAE